MDKKSIRNITGLFVFVIIVGCASTFFVKSVVERKRNDLYASVDNEQTGTTPTETTTNDSNAETSANGPVSNRISKDEYMKELELIEMRIAEVWENVTESNSALSAAKYEKGVWDEQLNKIYNLYFDKQSSTDREKLRQEQNSYETERERQSIAAAKSASEALDGLSYNKEYARLTKEKTYNYIERYFLED